MFDFIPAIDLLDGQVVRLYKGRYDDVTKYNLDPIEVINEFILAGVRLVHIVDLNAARDGNLDVNIFAIEKIQKALYQKAKMEIGGGIRNIDIVKEYLERGVDRVIIGTAAIKDPEFVHRAISEYGSEKIIVGVDALDGSVRVSGWQEDSNIKVDAFLKNLEERGVAEIIFTDIERDGAMVGPAIKALAQILDSTGLRVIASGGISSLSDLQTLVEMKHPRLVGAISGKAVYEKKINIDEAVALCQNKK